MRLNAWELFPLLLHRHASTDAGGALTGELLGNAKRTKCGWKIIALRHVESADFRFLWSIILLRMGE